VIALRPGSSIWRAAFLAYVAVVVVLTHWPRLTLDVPGVERPDLFVHMAVFGMWALLLMLSGLVGRISSVRAVLLAGLIAASYAAVDEGTQAIKFFHRTVAWDDLAANLAGIVIVTAVACGLAATRRTSPGKE
jgi:VanZ family protein